MRLKKLLKIKNQLKLASYILTSYLLLMITLTGLIEVYSFMNYQENTYTFIKPVQAREIKEEIILREVKSETIREITAYNVGDINQCSGNPCVSANGENICLALEMGFKRCAANFVPLGTDLMIDGYGECKVTDRLNSRYKNRVDIAMRLDEIERAKKFGLQHLNVRILK